MELYRQDSLQYHFFSGAEDSIILEYCRHCEIGLEDDGMKAGFIGAGKLGFSLGRFFAENGVHVTGYYSRHIESAMEAAEFTGSRCYEDLELLVCDSDVLFLTVPDEAIGSTYEKLKQYDIAGKQICHCSGALSSEETFPDAKERGAQRYSIHPLFPVSDKSCGFREMPDAFFCLEGDDSEGLKAWESFLNDCTAGTRRIDGGNKAAYHGACAIASNLYCALADLSVRMLEDCGFEEEEALRALSPLMRSNMEHILRQGPVEALTGPVERGDAATVRKHIDSIILSDDLKLYAAASKAAVKMAEAKNPDRDYSEIRAVLDAAPLQERGE
ncbi:MAG: Rossmann-like and DUF2520 domain-containing protein [Lentihominibacter sp.]